MGPGSHITIRHCTFEGHDRLRPGGTVIELLYSLRTVCIEDNQFGGFPSASDVMGVTLSTNWRSGPQHALPNEGTIIRRNRFYGFGGDGVQVGPWGGSHTLIENNHFERKYNDPQLQYEENAIDVKLSDFTTIRGNLICGYRPKAPRVP